MNLYLALANEGGGYVFKDNKNLMDVFLAGLTGRSYVMGLYLAGPHSNKQITDKVELYLAGQFPCNPKFKGELCNNFQHKIYILESFYYIADWMLPYINTSWNFMLDSGAFTFFSGDGNVDWIAYTKRYCKFINQQNIELFFELDIDVITSTKVSEELRHIIEQETGKQPIPVWRPMRGMDYWHRMIAEYPYIAISASGMFDSAWTRKPQSFKLINQMIAYAHKNNVEVHGLGYTSLPGLIKCNFDSVDSTAWIYGNRGGYLYKFNGHNIVRIDAPAGLRLKARDAAIHNFSEWVKFQRYAKANL